MPSYLIKTNKHNIFTGTRAEAITADLGPRRRVVAGDLGHVLPALATLDDLNKISPEKAEIVLQTGALDYLEGFLERRFVMKDFFLQVASGVYGIETRDYTHAENPVVLVMNMNRDDTLAPEIADLLSGMNSTNIFVYSGNALANPKAKIPRRLQRHANMFVNNKMHNAFFNSQLGEIVEDLEPDELLVVGNTLEDEVFYTALGAVDLDFKPKVVLMPSYVNCEETGYRIGRNLIVDHCRSVLNTRPRDGYGHDARSGITIYLE